MSSHGIGITCWACVSDETPNNQKHLWTCRLPYPMRTARRCTAGPVVTAHCTAGFEEVKRSQPFSQARTHGADSCTCSELHSGACGVGAGAAVYDWVLCCSSDCELGAWNADFGVQV
jgi:hypothetical protein